MKNLNLRSFIKESGLLEEVQRITKRTDEGLPDEENIIEEFKKNFLILFSDIDVKIIEKYAKVLKSYDILVNPTDRIIYPHSYVIITKKCMKIISIAKKALILNGVVELMNVKASYAKNESMVKLTGGKDCFIMAWDNSIVTIDGEVTGRFYDGSRGIAKGKSTAYFENDRNSSDYNENIVTDFAKAVASGDRKTLCLKNSFCKFTKSGYSGLIYDKSTAIVENGSRISCFDESVAEGRNSSTIHGYDKSLSKLKDFSRGFIYGNAKVEAEDQTVVYARGDKAPEAKMGGVSVIFIEETVDKKNIILKDESSSIVYKAQLFIFSYSFASASQPVRQAGLNYKKIWKNQKNY